MNDDYIQPMISDELGRSTPNAAVDRNYYAHGAQVPALFEIDGISIPALVAEFGSPLFVYSEHNLRSKARRARDAFRSRYPNTSFAWSYKTNYLNAVCRILRQEGWLAEVVSDFEYQKARKLGFSGRDIVFNGPHKPRSILERAISERALIQIDNWDELNLVETLAKDLEPPPVVASHASRLGSDPQVALLRWQNVRDGHLGKPVIGREAPEGVLVRFSGGRAEQHPGGGRHGPGGRPVPHRDPLSSGGRATCDVLGVPRAAPGSWHRPHGASALRLQEMPFRVPLRE